MRTPLLRAALLSAALLLLAALLLAGCAGDPTDASQLPGAGGPCPAGAKFGHLTPGGFSSSLGTNMQAQPVALPCRGVIVAVGFYTNSSGIQIRAAVYADAGGQPGAFVAGSAPIAAPSGWSEYPIGGVSLGAGLYWIGMQAASGASIPAVAEVVPTYTRTYLSFGSAYSDPYGGSYAGDGNAFNAYLLVQP